MKGDGKTGNAKGLSAANGGNDGGRKSFDRPVFIEGFLNADDREWLESHMGNKLVYVGELLDALEDTYVLKVKFELDTSRFFASITTVVKNHVNSGCCLVARGATPIDTLYALAYRHFVKFEGEWRGAGGENDSLWD